MVGSDHFDVVAKPDGPTKPEQFRLMLQSLLAKRFQLLIHREVKEVPIYALVVAKNGAKFKDANESDPYIAELNGRADLPAGTRPRVNIVRRGR